MTRYDLARSKERDLEHKRDAILSKPEPRSSEDARMLIVLGVALGKAHERVKTELERSTDDASRRNKSIDEWRATPEGKVARNEKARKVRKAPNARLSEMTPEERKQHEAELNADRVWRAKQRKKGLSEDEISIKLAARIAEREQSRKETKEADDITELPTYGMF